MIPYWMDECVFDNKISKTMFHLYMASLVEFIFQNTILNILMQDLIECNLQDNKFQMLFYSVYSQMMIECLKFYGLLKTVSGNKGTHPVSSLMFNSI